ncbi:MAG: ComEA family DNA-binding protein [Candidatus Eisenbacteria bacterium]
MTQTGGGGGSGEIAQGRLDLNHASVTDLDALPGIGPVLAGRIVAYRRDHGPFRSVDELLAVRGVGPKSFGRLRERVTVGAPRGTMSGP